MDYFFYGTLMDPEVLAGVTGRRFAPGAVETAFLDGCRRVRVADAWFPMLITEPGGRVEGRLVHGIDEAAGERIAAYEGGLFDPAPVTVTVPGRPPREARAFMARPTLKPGDRDWEPGK